MRDLNFSIKKLCDRNRDGSFSTQSNRRQQLNQISNELRDLGFKDVKSTENLKPKHVWRLVEKWQRENLSTGSIKNRMSNLRWVAEKIGNTSLVAKDNKHYGIADRQYSTNENKSLEFTPEKLNKIEDAHVRASAVLQREFGLRREEAMKIIPAKADHGDTLHLQSSWCKGGRERDIPIATESQREALDQAKALAGTGSLIPANSSYAQQMRIFQNQMRGAGLGQTHGARHAYAQRRYQELVGRRCPAAGGTNPKSRKEEIREKRLIISRELGHERESITTTYLGR